MKLIRDTVNNLQILQSHTQIALPTPSNITVNPNKKWVESIYPNTPLHKNTPILQLPNYQTNFPLKLHPQFSYHTDGSFQKPQEFAPGEWRRERAGYDIYSPKGLNIAKRLHGHQNILRAEIMAIYQTLRLINTQFPNEPAFIDHIRNILFIVLKYDIYSLFVKYTIYILF